jgi:hypothetical protein
MLERQSRTVFCVKLFYLPDIPATADHVEVEFVEMRDSRKFRTWNMP